MKNLNNLVTRTAECHRVFAGQRDLDYVAVNYSEAMLIKAEVDDRIAELTADLKVADRAALELAAEVERYKDALHRVDQRCIDERNGSAFDAMYGMQEIARNALKEGV